MNQSGIWDRLNGIVPARKPLSPALSYTTQETPTASQYTTAQHYLWINTKTKLNRVRKRNSWARRASIQQHTTHNGTTSCTAATATTLSEWLKATVQVAVEEPAWCRRQCRLQRRSEFLLGYHDDGSIWWESLGNGLHTVRWVLDLWWCHGTIKIFQSIVIARNIECKYTVVLR